MEIKGWKTSKCLVDGKFAFPTVGIICPNQDDLEKLDTLGKKFYFQWEAHDTRQKGDVIHYFMTKRKYSHCLQPFMDAIHTQLDLVCFEEHEYIIPSSDYPEE